MRITGVHPMKQPIGKWGGFPGKWMVCRETSVQTDDLRWFQVFFYFRTPPNDWSGMPNRPLIGAKGASLNSSLDYPSCRTCKADGNGGFGFGRTGGVKLWKETDGTEPGMKCDWFGSSGSISDWWDHFLMILFDNVGRTIVNHPWLGMVEYQLSMVMTGGWLFITSSLSSLGWYTKINTTQPWKPCLGWLFVKLCDTWWYMYICIYIYIYT